MADPPKTVSITANHQIESLKKNMLVDGFSDFVVQHWDSAGRRLSRGSYLNARLECEDPARERDVQILDFFTHFATSPFSYNHPMIFADEDFLDRLRRVATEKPSCADFYWPEMAVFVEAMERVAATPQCHKMFFIEGGALAVENALKAAFNWRVRKNIKLGICDEDDQNQMTGQKVICFDEAFHGRSGYTMSMTHTNDPRKYKYFPKFDWFRIPPPAMKFELNGDEKDPEVRKLREDLALDEVRRILKENPNDIAAVVIEPIQSEGGDNHFSHRFLKGLSDICHDPATETLFILDEVQTGFGLTGQMWCHQHFAGVVPDIIAFGKKFQVCGILAGGRILEEDAHVFDQDNKEGKSRINSTFGGNLTDMFRCTRYLEILEEPIDGRKLLSPDPASDGERGLIEEHGVLLLDGVRKIGHSYRDLISNPRGRGLMVAFDLPDEDLRDDLFQRLLSGSHANMLEAAEAGVKHMLVLKCGPRSLRFRPHLDVSAYEIVEALSILEERVAQLKKS